MRLVRAFAAGGMLALVACSASSEDAASGGEQAATVAPCSIADRATLDKIAAIDDVADACAANPGPTLGAPQGFKHSVEHLLFPRLGANHRGRDSFYAVGDPQWVLGKFAYGVTDKDLKDEPVDIYVLRGCAGQWDKLGTATTTREHEHATVEGVDDQGGRVYFQIPAGKELPIGRHRVRMVVQGDNSAADQFIEVLPKGAAIFVSDMDGTLTERKDGDNQLACDEESDFPALWRAARDGDDEPAVHAGAAEAFHKLVDQGYRPMYLTARPEWLVPHTRHFLLEATRRDGRGDLPQGIIHTTVGLTGALNSAAEAFKKAELQMLVDKGFKVGWGFGNRPSDVATYRAFKVPFRMYYENADTARRQCSRIEDLPELPSTKKPKTGDYRIHSYEDVSPLVVAAGAACKAR